MKLTAEETFFTFFLRATFIFVLELSVSEDIFERLRFYVYFITATTTFEKTESFYEETSKYSSVEEI